MSYTLQQIADKIGATVQGDPSCEIFSAASLASATEKDICFVKDKQHAQAIADSKAAALIVSEDVLPKDDTQHHFLIVPQPRLSFITVLHLLYPEKKLEASIHPTAVLGEGVEVADGVTIKAYAVLGDRVTVGANTIIESNVNVGDDVVIGDSCRIYANASLYRQTQLGNRCIIHSGAVIGADGFGFEADENGRWQKVPQVGCVKLADDVEIGANTCIDCGALDDTEIADGVKIDDQVMIGHNVKIGAHTIIAGGVGIAGSTTIGKHCMLGGASCINGHITLADGVMVAGSSNIGSSIDKPGFYLGALEALPYREWARCAQKFYQLNEMKKTLNKLEKAVIA